METSEKTAHYQRFVGVDSTAVTATVAWQAAGGPTTAVLAPGRALRGLSRVA